MAEALLRNVDHRQHRRRHRPVFLDEAIADFLGVECEVTQLRQADHATAALKRMESAAHRAQRFPVAGIAREVMQTRRDRIEHFRRLQQVDLEKLAVESVGVGRQQPLRFLGDLGCRRRGFRHRADGRGEIGGLTTGELLERQFDLVDKLLVADQFSVVAQSCQLLFQAFARCGMQRSMVDFPDEIRKGRTQLRDCGLD